MPQYTVTDPQSGRSMTLTGDSPPTEAELTEIFGKVNAAPAGPEGSALSRFASNAGEMLNPVTMVKGLAHAAAHPIDTGRALLGAQVDQGRQALDLYRQGRYTEAAGHAGAAALPILGPVAANAGEQIASGDIAGGFGKSAGLLGSLAVPGAIGKLKGVRVLPGMANANPVAADAVAFAQDAKLPVNAATATGNKFVASAQHIVDRSLLGSVVSGHRAVAEAKGLATLGEQLAAKGHPTAMTQELSGQGVRNTIRGNMQDQAAIAHPAYEYIRDAAASPEHLDTIDVAPKIGTPEAAAGRLSLTRDGRFAEPGARVGDIFQGVLGDARKQGFRGKVSDLRAAFDDHLDQAKSLKAEDASAHGEYSDEALLSAIRERGGLQSFEKDTMQGAPSVRRFDGEGGMGRNLDTGKGAASVYRAKGLPPDEMLQSLHQDQQWQAHLPEDFDLGDHVQNILRDQRNGVMERGSETGNLEHYLHGAGVTPGSKWWGPEIEGTKQIPMAVDLRGVRAALRPIRDEIMSRYPVAQQEASKGLKALNNIVDGPDYDTLPTADANLGAIKSIARTSDFSELRNVSQGLAAGAVKKLEAAVMGRARQAGPDIVDALQTGRRATIAKYESDRVLETLNKSAVKTHKALTSPDDANIEQLLDVAKQAPDELPKIGRAVLDRFTRIATKDGGFKHADRIAAEWDKIGPRTRQLLFKDPGYVYDIDRYIRYAKAAAENVNPSGSGRVVMAGGEMATWIHNPLLGAASSFGLGAASKLLNSRAGVQLLTKGLRLPLGKTSARAAWLGEVAALTNPSGSSSTTAAPAPAP